MTPSEERLLLTVLELEKKAAEARRDHWESKDDAPAYEQGYAAGAATAWMAAHRIIEQTVNTK